MALFFFNIGIPCKNAQDCAKRFLCVNYFHLYENNPVGQQMQKGEWSLWGVAGKFWSWVVLQKHKNFCFCFLFATDMLPNRHNDQVLLHQTQGGEKKRNRNPGRHDQYIQYVLYFFPPAWLPVCPATRLVLKQLHVAIYLPPSQMDLCHFGRCFTALIHCSNCFMLAHVGFTMETASLDHFILMQFWCLCFPIWASNMIKSWWWHSSAD